MKSAQDKWLHRWKIKSIWRCILPWSGTRGSGHFLSTPLMQGVYLFLPSVLRCHALWRWGSLSVLIRIHGCQDPQLGQFSLLCSLASLTGYWSGPISSLLSQPTHPGVAVCARGPGLYEKSRTPGGRVAECFDFPVLIHDVFAFAASAWFTVTTDRIRSDRRPAQYSAHGGFLLIFC